MSPACRGIRTETRRLMPFYYYHYFIIIFFLGSSSVKVKRLRRSFQAQHFDRDGRRGMGCFFFSLLLLFSFFFSHASPQPVFNSFWLKVANPSNCVFTPASCLHLSETEFKKKESFWGILTLPFDMKKSASKLFLSSSLGSHTHSSKLSNFAL